MLGLKVLKLKTEEEKNIYYNKSFIKKLKKEVESLLKKVNDFNVSNELIATLQYEKGKERSNLSNGYLYILGSKEITKENIRELYNILSKDLLDEYSKENMGEFYREKDVYILDTNNDLVGFYDKGINPEKIEEKMDSLLDYIDEDNIKNIVDTYIKSQIIHYYMTYIHPYYDVNGRTARMVSTWYLLKEKSYPFILFNKGVYKNKTEYKKTIKKCRRGDITSFLEFSLKVLKDELEDYIISSYEGNDSIELKKKK